MLEAAALSPLHGEPTVWSALRWIALVPLAGAAVNLTLGASIQRAAGRAAVAGLSIAAAAAALALSVAGFLELAALEPDARRLADVVAPWIRAGSLDVSLGFAFDPLTAVMCLVVTGVGTLIHVYSYGYMDEEPSLWRFFGLLNLFLFAMLTLVLADNVLLLFVGWEGVGLCSWALIGFWYRDHANTTAANKAFLVNRIGDFAFLCGTALLFWSLADAGRATLTFSEMPAAIGALREQTIFGLAVPTVVALLLFGGAAGKSAQLPLYVWLPDAMAGPTPVSALIHAATMVTAGVYLLARMSFLYTAAPQALAVVATVGAATAVFAASIGLTQTDIKKVLAYSTVSQLGFMFLAMGCGAYSAGVFHLVTHAFFKACLFLGAGSVIHALHHEQDMRRMGGLRRRMPITFWTFVVAGLALAGVPPLAGFFSKDAILWRAYVLDERLWVAAAVAAAMTAFYVMRQIAMTFLGEASDAGRLQEGHGPSHARESSAFMTVPLLVLAAGAVGAGWLGIPDALGGSNRFEAWLDPVFAGPRPAGMAHGGHSVTEEYVLVGASVAIALAGIAGAALVYVRRAISADTLAAFAGGVPYRWSAARYYVDEFYGRTFVAGTLALARALAWFDHYVVDGAVNAAATIVRTTSAAGGAIDRHFVDGAVRRTAAAFDRAGAALRAAQTGSITGYLYVLLFGVTLALVAGTF